MYQSLRHEHDMSRITGRLREVADAALDVVAPSTAVSFGVDSSTMTLDQPVVAPDGVYESLPVSFNRTALRQQADRFGIPLKYVDLLAEQQPALLATNLNERSAATNQLTLYRLLRHEAVSGGSAWGVRAALSNGYQAIDNVDMLTAVVRGAAKADIDLGDCHVEGDWSDDRFRLRIAVPQISIAVPNLLGDYRSPWGAGGEHVHVDARTVGDHQVGDVIWAGLEVSNSETGGGAVSVAPRAFVLRCRNGMVRKTDIVRSVHLGGRLDAGPVQWSHETRRKSVELVEARMADAVTQFCSVPYLEALAAEMSRAKGVEVVNPVQAMEVAKTRLGFTEDEVDAALMCFTRSGDTSVLGLGQAVTAAAQASPDGDRQSELEQSFWDIVGAPAAYTGATA